MKFTILTAAITMILAAYSYTTKPADVRSAEILTIPISSAIDGNPHIGDQQEADTPANPVPAAKSKPAPAPIKDQTAEADVPNYNASQREIACLASVIHFEARGEPREGQIAVAEVVIARAESSFYPDDLCAVVRQPKQFSFVRNGHVPEVPQEDRAKRVKMAKRVANGLIRSRARGALYFHANYAAPKWRHKMTLIAQVGAHIFYRR